MITCHYCGEQLAPNSEAVYSHVKIHYAENENNSQKHEILPEVRTRPARDLRHKSAIITKK